MCRKPNFKRRTKKVTTVYFCSLVLLQNTKKYFMKYFCCVCKEFKRIIHKIDFKSLFHSRTNFVSRINWKKTDILKNMYITLIHILICKCKKSYWRFSLLRKGDIDVLVVVNQAKDIKVAKLSHIYNTKNVWKNLMIILWWMHALISRCKNICFSTRLGLHKGIVVIDAFLAKV